MRIKNITVVSAYVLLTALLFSGAYVVGTSTVKNDRENEVPVKEESAVEVSGSSADPHPEYEVLVEDGRLYIYKCIGDMKTVVMSEEISERVFPPEDVAELKKGVRFDRLEGAQQMYENFVS